MKNSKLIKLKIKSLLSVFPIEGSCGHNVKKEKKEEEEKVVEGEEEGQEEEEEGEEEGKEEDSSD